MKECSFICTPNYILCSNLDHLRSNSSFMPKGMYIHIEHYLCLLQSRWSTVGGREPKGCLTQMRAEMQNISTSHTGKVIPCFSTNILLNILQGCEVIVAMYFFLLLRCTFKKYILISLTLGTVLELCAFSICYSHL